MNYSYSFLGEKKVYHNNQFANFFVMKNFKQFANFVFIIIVIYYYL